MIRFLLAAIVGSLTHSALAAEIANWPAWRGPKSAGSIEAGTFPSAWSGDKEKEKLVRWKVELPGIGCSTPIVWDKQIIVTAPSAGSDAVLAFDLDGKPLWTTPIGPQKPGKHRNGSGSNPSAVTDGKYLFAYYKSGNLAGLDLAGKLLWKTNLQDRFAKDTLYWDIGTSPVIVDDAVVVAVMHSGESYLAAFDKDKGDLKWKVSRNYKTPVEGDHSYATPIVIDHRGKQALLVWGAEHLTAHSASDGSELWSCGGFNPKKNGNWVQVASHVVAGDMAIVPYGRGSHLCGVWLGGDGDVTDTHREWTRTGVGTFVPTPTAYKDKVYIVGDEGQVECLEAKTGKTVWSDRFPKNRNKFYASPLVAGGKLYAPREDGVVLVAGVADKFELLSENDLGARTIASPVPLGNRLLLRSETHLWCVGE